MTTDDLFIKSDVDVTHSIADNDNPLAGLPLWAATHSSFIDYCRAEKFDIAYSFNLIFYGDWDTLLKDDRIYDVICDAVNIIDNIRVRHSMIHISYRPDVVHYHTLTNRFPDKRPYVEGVSITVAADFTNRGTQFLRMIYGLMQMTEFGNFSKYYPELTNNKAGLTLKFYFTNLNNLEQSDLFESWQLSEPFYLSINVLILEDALTKFWKFFIQYAKTIGDPDHSKTEKFIRNLHDDFHRKINSNNF